MIVVLRMKKAIQLTNQNPTNARCITVHGLQFSAKLTPPTVATVYAKWIYGQADTGALSDRSRHVQKIWEPLSELLRCAPLGKSHPVLDAPE